MRVRFVVIGLMLTLTFPHLMSAQSASVSPSELRQAIQAAATARQKNLDDVRSFFSSEQARAALKSGKVDYEKVQKAIATLSPEELARLAARATQVQKDFAGGALSNQELTYIVIALGAAVLVLIVVAAD